MEDKNLMLAELLFSHITKTPEDMENEFSARELPEGAKVTRIAPSPTGFVHFGNLFPAMVSERLARQSGGKFILRIEDTDSLRKVDGAVETIIDSFAHYGLIFDEGVTKTGESGAYGPYSQSQRAHIYHVFAKDLVKRGLAYPCFMTKEELEAIREEQEKLKILPGCYGQWAKYRDADIETVKKLIEDGVPYVLRLRSPGTVGGRINFTDVIKGKLEMDENYVDQVLLKSDGIPTYHFAHAVDDHLMHVTHVVRGEEWLSSLPLHIQLFKILGFKLPKYLHISLLMKLDGTSKRKLSKRHDPEAALTYYREQGYPVSSVREYVMTLLNSNYEEWRIQNPKSPLEDFKFTTAKMGHSGSLFDLNKLDDVSKNAISVMSAKEVTNEVIDWSKDNDTELYELFSKDIEYTESIFEIGRNDAKPRKDISKWKEIRNYAGFFFDSLYRITDAIPENISKDDALMILTKYKDIYDESDDSSAWFDRLKAMAVEMGYAEKPKDYKKNPELYKGHVGDISMVLRIAMTGKCQSPDLCSIMKILGKVRVNERIDACIKYIEEN